MKFLSELWLTPGGFLFAVIIGWVIELIFAISSQSNIADTLRAFSIIWFVSASAFFVGTLIGFLFGIPRSEVNSKKQKDTASENGVRFSQNTNLEEISDWLTKIIIGISLSQFSDILNWISLLGNYIGSNLGGKGAETIAIASMIYGFVCGFLYYYLWARTIVRQILKKGDWKNESEQK